MGKWLKESRLLYGFVGAFVVVALAFIASSIGTFYASKQIDTAGKDLLGNALPSVMELMRARTAQRRLDIDVDVLSRTRSSRAELLDELVNARAELDEALRAAMFTPNYPGEGELYDREVKPRLATLDQRIDELRAAIARDSHNERAIEAAIARLNAAGKEVDEALASLAELNQTQAFDAANRIVNTRAETVRLALYMEAGSAVLAIIAAAVAVRAGRRFAEDARARLEHESARASELDLLAQRVAHDLMSPLQAVAMSLGSVQRAHPDPQTGRAVERASRALERSRRMVQGIYAFSRAGARPVPGATAPLRETVVEAADGLLAAEHDPPAVDLQAVEDAEVAMDRAVLAVVVGNLLSNAFKFTRDAPVRQVSVRSRVGPMRVHVEVEDSGPGVPPGLEDAVFEPYRRAPGVTQPGLGLGLATVKRMVLAHGGKLGVHRAPSGGAIFWFDVPRAAVTHAVTSPELAPATASADTEARPLH